MAPPTLHPIKLPGPWSEGFVLEGQHTLSSTLIGHDSNGNPQFDTKRSELGELVFRLKNRSDKTTLEPIADTAAEFVRGWRIQFHAVVPIPPSRRRAFQPVVEIAKTLGTRLSKPVLPNAVRKVRETPELKDVFDYGERQKLLGGRCFGGRKAIEGQQLLVVDDLYRSGATASVVVQSLVDTGAEAVYFLALTKTRTRS